MNHKGYLSRYIVPSIHYIVKHRYSDRPPDWLPHSTQVPKIWSQLGLVREKFARPTAKKIFYSTWVRVWNHFELCGPLWTTNNRIYYSYVRLYASSSKFRGHKLSVNSVENIPYSTGTTLDHFVIFGLLWQCNCSCLPPKLRTCRAGLKPFR